MAKWENPLSHITKSSGKPSQRNGGYYYNKRGLNAGWAVCQCWADKRIWECVSWKFSKYILHKWVTLLRLVTTWRCGSIAFALCVCSLLSLHSVFGHHCTQVIFHSTVTLGPDSTVFYFVTRPYINCNLICVTHKSFFLLLLLFTSV